MRFKFVAETNEDAGFVGWRKADRSDFDPAFNPMLIAHDVLEHPRTQKFDPCADEFIALGCVIWGRGEGGYFWKNPNYRSIGEMIAHDLESQYSIYQGADYLQDPGRTTRLDETVEHEIEVAIQKATKMLLEEGYDRDGVITFLEQSRGWLRKGYRWAQARWYRAGQNSFTFTRMFEAIERHVPKYEPELGQEMYIHVCMKAGTISVNVFNWYERGHSQYTPEEEW